MNVSVTGILSKVAGTVTVGSLLYDASICAKAQQKTSKEDRLGERMLTQIRNSSSLEAPSSTHNAIKKEILLHQIDTDWRENIASCFGIAKGFFRYLASQWIPFTAGVVAIFSGKLPGKLCGLGLGIAGAWTLLRDYFDLGKQNELNNKLKDI